MVALPRLVVAAPGSGHGKTMLTTGLLAALHRRGTVVSAHKVGPDYIDPGYHAAACGRVGRNLDPMLQSEDLVPALLLHGATTPTPADVAVVEGVMGLFDGRIGGDGFASTAHVARLVEAPVVLVVDAASASRSAGAVVLGFTLFDPRVRVGGVILNNVASARHEAEARSGIAATGVPVLGVVPRASDVVVPSRHLGLVPAAERSPQAQAAVDALADLVAEHVDLDAVLDLAGTAPDLAARPWSAADAVGTTVPGQPVVAVAGGPAFTFGYAETTELLEAAGCTVRVVDPLSDQELPPGTAALLVGGGFPEVHAERLAENEPLRRAVAAFAADGGVVVGECAGLLYLGSSLDGHAMCGVLPTHAEFGTRLTLGYRCAVALTDSVLGPAGTRTTGHEFHRTRIVGADGDVVPAWGWQREGRPVREGAVHGRVHASYLHTHWAGQPHLARTVVEALR